MEGEDLQVRTECQRLSDDVIEFKVSAEGVDIRFTYLVEKSDIAQALIDILPDVICDAIESSLKGDVEVLEAKDPFDEIPFAD